MNTQKSTTARIIILTLALAGIIAVPAAIIRAQSYEPVIEEEALAKSSESKSERMEGSWVVTVTAAVPPGVPQPPDFRAYASCARGGVPFGRVLSLVYGRGPKALRFEFPLQDPVTAVPPPAPTDEGTGETAPS